MGVAAPPEAGQAVGMAEQHPDHRPKTGPEAQGAEKLTVFGEPLWVDALKTLGVGTAMLLGVVVIGALLGVAVIAPWGRACPDCSIYCVLEWRVDAILSGKPSCPAPCKSLTHAHCGQ